MLCIALHCVALLRFVLLCIALHCFALLCIAFHCFALLCIALHCFALFCIALLCFALLCIALLCMDLLRHWSALLCFEKLSATFQQALFKKKLEPLKAKHNDQYIYVYIWTVYVIHDAAIGTLFLRSRLASSS